MHSGNAAAIPEVRNDATLSFCHASRSVRITTAILVSNCMNQPDVVPGWSDGLDLRCASAHRGIRRFSDVQLHIVVRCFASPRNDDWLNLPLGVAGPGADHAFLAAEFVAFFRRFVERARNVRLDGVAVGAAGNGHVDRKCCAGPLHGHRGAAATPALPERRLARRVLGRIIKGLTIGAAFAYREGTRRPGLSHESRAGDRQRQCKYKQRAASRDGSRNNQNPLPRRPAGANLRERTFQLGEHEIEIDGCRIYARRAASSACGVSMSRNAPWPSTGTSATASLCLAIRWRAPISPSSVINSVKKRRDHSTGLPRLLSLTGTAIRLPRSGANASISRSIRCAEISGISPRQMTAPSAFSGTAAMPALTELANPSTKSGLCTNFTFRPCNAFSTCSA